MTVCQLCTAAAATTTASLCSRPAKPRSHCFTFITKQDIKYTVTTLINGNNSCKYTKSDSVMKSIRVWYNGGKTVVLVIWSDQSQQRQAVSSQPREFLLITTESNYVQLLQEKEKTSGFLVGRVWRWPEAAACTCTLHDTINSQHYSNTLCPV